MTKHTNPVAPRQPLWLRVLGLVALALFGVGFYLAIFASPADINQGNLIRIMYAHVSGRLDFVFSRLLNRAVRFHLPLARRPRVRRLGCRQR